MTLLKLLAVLTLTLTLFSMINAEEPATCDCLSIGNSYLVTRLWNIIDPNWTDQMVIDEFDRGFAPEVTNLPGFEEYASATTGNNRTVFFMNVFETQELAKAAQEGAKTFVQKGVLNGKITPNEFDETELNFHLTKDECLSESLEGRYLGTELWTLTEEAVFAGNWTIASVVEEVEVGHGPSVTNTAGFQVYGGAFVTSTDFVFFYQVFDSLEGVQMAHQASEAFIQNHPELGTSMEKIVFTEGPIDFDYTCAAGNIPPPPLTYGADSSALPTTASISAMVISLMSMSMILV